MRVPAFAFLALLLASCRDKPNVAPVDAGRLIDAAAPRAAVADAAADLQLANGNARAAPAYFAALARGRRSTAAKDYPAAIRAFDEAVANGYDDTRALAERGYAKLLAKDLEGAQADLLEARRYVPRQTPDQKLRAQILFNLGLVDEALGDEDGAAVDYMYSNDSFPTPAAKAKRAALEGRVAETCGVRVTRRPRDLPTASSMASLATLLGTEGEEVICLRQCADGSFRFGDSELPADCKAHCDPNGKTPFVVTTNAADHRFTLVVPGAKKLAFDPLLDAHVARCGMGDLSFELVRVGALLDVKVAHRYALYVTMCTYPGDGGERKLDLCNGGEGEEPAGTACPPNDVTNHLHVVVDDAAKRHLVAAESNEDGEPIAVTADGLTLRRERCVRTEPFSK